MSIRSVVEEDIPDLKKVLESIELFPSEFLDEMISDYFSNANSEDIWLTKVLDNKCIAIAYCAPEKFTDGTYNLYAIGVTKEFQGKGTGGEMMRYVEELLTRKSARLLLVETSGDPQFELTRRFYDGLGYKKEAVIREFWKEGEDKIVFWKKLN